MSADTQKAASLDSTASRTRTRHLAAGFETDLEGLDGLKAMGLGPKQYARRNSFFVSKTSEKASAQKWSSPVQDCDGCGRRGCKAVAAAGMSENGLKC